MQRGYTERDNAENVLVKQGAIILPVTPLYRAERDSANWWASKGQQRQERAWSFWTRKSFILNQALSHRKLRTKGKDLAAVHAV